MRSGPLQIGSKCFFQTRWRSTVFAQMVIFMYSLRGSYKLNNEENTKTRGRFPNGLGCMSAIGPCLISKIEGLMKQNVQSLSNTSKGSSSIMGAYVWDFQFYHFHKVRSSTRTCHEECSQICKTNFWLTNAKLSHWRARFQSLSASIYCVDFDSNSHAND